MRYMPMTNPKYSTVLAVTGAGDEGLPDIEGDAQRALLNHVMLQRFGVDMQGRLGIDSTRGKLAQIYIEQEEGATPEEKAKKAVRKVNDLILAFNKKLDTLRFPNAGVGQSR